MHFLDLKPHVESEALRQYQRLSQLLVNCADGFAVMGDTLRSAQQALVGLGVVLIMQSVIADSQGSSAVLVRRYRFNEQTQQVEEVPLTPVQVQEISEIWNRVGVQIRTGFDQSGRDRTVMIFPDLRNEEAIERFMNPIVSPGLMVQPAIHPERVRMQGYFEVLRETIADMFRILPGWVLGPVLDRADEEENIYSPGEEAVRTEIAKVLMEYVKQSNKEDFTFLARSEAHISDDKIDEVWEGARRKLKLDQHPD